jgi:hypothetical protein
MTAFSSLAFVPDFLVGTDLSLNRDARRFANPEGELQCSSIKAINLRCRSSAISEELQILSLNSLKEERYGRQKR